MRYANLFDVLARVGVRTRSADSLVGGLERVKGELDAYRTLKYPCACGCGTLLQFTEREFREVLKKGALAEWHLTAHEDAFQRKHEAGRAAKANEDDAEDDDHEEEDE